MVSDTVLFDPPADTSAWKSASTHLIAPLGQRASSRNWPALAPERPSWLTLVMPADSSSGIPTVTGPAVRAMAAGLPPGSASWTVSGTGRPACAASGDRPSRAALAATIDRRRAKGRMGYRIVSDWGALGATVSVLELIR